MGLSKIGTHQHSKLTAETRKNIFIEICFQNLQRTAHHPMTSRVITQANHQKLIRTHWFYYY
jgi:hypothetical protein